MDKPALLEHCASKKGGSAVKVVRTCLQGIAELALTWSKIVISSIQTAGAYPQKVARKGNKGKTLRLKIFDFISCVRFSRLPPAATFCGKGGRTERLKIPLDLLERDYNRDVYHDMVAAVGFEPTTNRV